MSIFASVVTALWVMLPAYVPNNVAVIAGGGPPLDGGRTLNGDRVLGDGKTWRGTVLGTAAGTLLALVLNGLHGTVSDLLSVSLPTFPVLAAVGLAFGAMVGDVGASFFKRRTGRGRGTAFPGLDQLDFVVGALVIAALVNSSWFTSTFTLPVLVTVFVATPLLHVTTNVVAHRLGLKNEPW